MSPTSSNPMSGACDCHVHIYELERYPLAGTATFAPPQASWAQYAAVQRSLGLTRAVLVQPTGYGFDNRCLLEALALADGAARGIVVIRPDTPAAELQVMHAAGVRGVRFMMIPGAGGLLEWGDIEGLAARIAEFGWVVNLQLDGRELPNYAARLRTLPCKLSLDHTGKFLEPVTTDHAAFRSLLDLLDAGNTWVKISAPYETSRVGPPHYDDVSALAQALAAAHPERCLWASNWPHPNRKPVPDDREMLDLLSQWAPDPAVRRTILVSNPASLYGFGAD